MGKYEFPKGKGKVLIVLWHIFVLCRSVLRGDGDVYIVKSRKLIACVLISAVNLPNTIKKKDKEDYTTSVAKVCYATDVG